MNKNFIIKKTIYKKSHKQTNQIYQPDGKAGHPVKPSFISWSRLDIGQHSKIQNAQLCIGWQKDGEFHRDQKPSFIVITYNKVYHDNLDKVPIGVKIYYYKNGLLHREDGPAAIFFTQYASSIEEIQNIKRNILKVNIDSLKEKTDRSSLSEKYYLFGRQITKKDLTAFKKAIKQKTGQQFCSMLLLRDIEKNTNQDTKDRSSMISEERNGNLFITQIVPNY